jgi:predicted acylesterase/phospholipase RssA
MTREAIRHAALAAVCVGTLLGAACTSVPRATNELEAARDVYRHAATNQQVQARAPVELELAERDLRDAENLQRADAEPAKVAHFSYLAAQRARIAMKTAELRAAEAAYAMANEQRTRLQAELSARERTQLPASSGETAR